MSLHANIFLKMKIIDKILMEYSYKNNHLSSGIRVANAQTKVIIFCKSHPINSN